MIFAFMNVGLILLSFGQGFYHKYTINVAYLTTVVGTTFIVFSYDAVGAKNRTRSRTRRRADAQSVKLQSRDQPGPQL